MHRSDRPSRSRSRRLTVGIAGLCLFAQFAALAHLVVVRHARCAEHGEVVHAREHAAGLDVVDALPDRGAPVAVRSSPEDADAHDDDHCRSLTERRGLRAVEPPAAVELQPILAEAARSPRTTPSVIRALYRLAPKISPPRTA